MVHWAIDSLHICLVFEIGRYCEYVFANGSDERERRVQHQCSIGRSLGVLVGIGDGDGTHGSSKTTSNTGNTERHNENQTGQIEGVVFLWRCVKPPEEPHDTHKQQHEIPMMNELRSDDTAQIPFVGKLAEYRRCRTTHCILEIDGIGKIDSQCDTINNKV